MSKVALVVLAVFFVGLAVVDGSRIIRGFNNNATGTTKFGNVNDDHSASLSQEDADDDMSNSQELPHRSGHVDSNNQRPFAQSTASAAAHASTFSHNQKKNLVK